MTVLTSLKELTYQDRLDILRQRKMTQTEEKQRVLGARDDDEWTLILPPPEYRKIVQTTNVSGITATNVLIDGIELKTNHPNGDFYGPSLCGENFQRLLEAHPPFIDPMCSLAGAVMVNFSAYHCTKWSPDFDYSHLHAAQQRYQVVSGVDGMLHFCPDLAIGLNLGWAGLLAKIRCYRQTNQAEADDFYDGLEHVVLGMQNWIGRNARAAREMAQTEAHPQLRANLEEVAEMNERLVSEPPQTFREACQWLAWYLMAAHMYNASIALGRLDVLLMPFYDRDIAAGRLTDEEGAFHIACLLLHNPAHAQLGGPDENGKDVTNRLSYLVLEAIDRLRVPTNIGVCVGDKIDPGLLRRGVEMQFAHKMGSPKFLGSDRTVEGLVKNGFPIEVARQRAYAGCHWSAIPGREYGMCDLKLNFAAVFDVALREMMADSAVEPSTVELWQRFKTHLKQAVDGIAEGLAFRMEHSHRVFPELVLDLLCHGPIEKGLDASQGGVEFYNLGIDGAALATVADSFAAIEMRIENEGRMSWAELMQHLDNNWAGVTGERARLMLKHVPSYGFGGAIGDVWAKRIAQTFTDLVSQRSTNAFKLTPGLFSFSNFVAMGQSLGATPNGRRAGEPISQGANPNAGFRQDGASTALAVAIASVQPGLGNTAPMQLELDPGLSRDEEAIDKISCLLKTHFSLGGTLINLNVLDKAKVLEAHRDPSKHPDLIVRVTGFSAYFAGLSPEFRQLVVDRIIAEG